MYASDLECRRRGGNPRANDNDEWAHGQDEDDDNIALPRPARLQGCEIDPEEESLFSNESDNDNDDNDPNDN